MPPKTKTNEPTLEQRVEDARAAQTQTEAKILELTAELNGIPERIREVDWSDEERAIAEVAQLERRRDGLPHYIRHLRRKAIEEELEALRLEGEELETRRQPLEDRVAQAQEVYDEARDALNIAKADQHELLYGAMSDNRRAVSDAEKRLAELDREIPTEAAPAVRSVWQMRRQSEDEVVHDTPGALHFGSANVNDKPLSAGDDSETVVIPNQAIERASKAG